MQEERLFTVGELAKKCEVSVRTLQFYDRCGLVCPGCLSVGGRRLYGLKEVMRLHQVLFLKTFGFSLDEIRDRLLPIQSAKELSEILQRQDKALMEQIKYLEETSKLIKRTVSEIAQSGDIHMTSLMAIMSAVQKGTSYSFILKYFGHEELDRMMGTLVSELDPYQMANIWQGMIEKLMELHKRSVDPQGAEGQQFAAQWWKMIEDISKDNPAFLKSALSAGADADNWPDEANEFKKAIKDFIGLAIEKYIKDQGIKLPE